MLTRAGSDRFRLAMTLAAVAALVVVAACGDDDDEAASSSSSTAPSASVGAEEGANTYPDIVDAVVEPAGDGTYDIEVTVSSPYDSPERYADGWRVLGPDGNELGTHQLAHDHAGEQPFTRTQRGAEIPEDVSQVTIEGRDLKNGYGGKTITVAVPDS